MAGLRATKESKNTFAIWRGDFKIGAVYLNDYSVHTEDRGWYAVLHSRAGRQSRQRKPNILPQAAAMKMWGSQGREAINVVIVGPEPR